MTVRGEDADDPDEYKGEPIPGGPTDPNAADEPGEGGQKGQDDERDED